jgi:hypothetical protein
LKRWSILPIAIGIEKVNSSILFNSSKQVVNA